MLRSFLLLPYLMPLIIALPSILLILFLLAGCNHNELARLQIENDSLRNELESGQRLVRSLTDIGQWLDSIDATRSVMLRELKEGTSDTEFSNRLKDINRFVTKSEEKIRKIQNDLETSQNGSSAYLMLVDALKNEMQLRVHDILILNEQVSKYKDENESLHGRTETKEKEVDAISIQLSYKQQELSLLEAKIQSLVNGFKAAQADAFFARARALEEAAKRTKLAPHKRRQTYKEAIELYKKSLSLGREDARVDIGNLEKKID
jgi:chromosome segregation ATPase